ncbi:hypothetical protein fugu_008559 [Takifugu bimaculatus]|uniref:G-protein coupled receptors family 1 profile domain-containing protein n=1 Tax=Takifugu bimaculatus TaxID=433685 RepID=A0A4Z2AW69_9TELE|nr:hypothetical protein fugu_008559 [Takifugu bimaculatus]
MAVILSAASGLIISTNLLVAAAVLKMLLKKSSQSWCFVLNLALADFLVGVAITGLAVEDFSMDGDTQKLRRLVSADPSVHSASPEGKFRCLLRMVLVMSPCTASMMSMFFISLDRYAAIKMPLRYSQLCGKGTTAGSLLVLWVSSLMIGFLPVMVQQLQTDSYDGFCSLFAVIRKVCMVIFSMCFFPVLSVFVYIYLDILKIACSHHKQIGLIRRVGSRTTDQRAGPRGHHHQQPRSCFWNHAKALRTVAVAGRLLLGPLVSFLRGGDGGAPVQWLQTHQRVAELSLASGTLQLHDQPPGVRLLAEGGAVTVGSHVLLLHRQIVGCQGLQVSPKDASFLLWSRLLFAFQMTRTSLAASLYPLMSRVKGRAVPPPTNTNFQKEEGPEGSRSPQNSKHHNYM